jgi:hypothetical protein
MTAREFQMPTLEHLAGWDRAVKAVRALAAADAESVRPYLPPSPQVVRTALALCSVLEPAAPAGPDGVYQLPDGNIVFEWQYTDGVIVRYEAEADGWVEVMVSYGGGKPPTFDRLRIATDGDPFHEANETYRTRGQWCGLNDFSLAS